MDGSEGKDMHITSVYIDWKKFKRAREMHLNLSALVDIALDQALEQLMENGENPQFKFLFFNRGKENRKTKTQEGMKQ